MRGKVTISGKDVEMLSSAASPILYKRVFRQDWFKVLTSAQEDETGIESISHFEEMGFIMAMQAKKTTAQLAGLCYDDFLEWITQFETEDLLNSIDKIASIYNGQEQTNSEPKKEGG